MFSSALFSICTVFGIRRYNQLATSSLNHRCRTCWSLEVSSWHTETKACGLLFPFPRASYWTFQRSLVSLWWSQRPISSTRTLPDPDFLVSPPLPINSWPVTQELIVGGCSLSGYYAGRTNAPPLKCKKKESSLTRVSECSSICSAATLI